MGAVRRPRPANTRHPEEGFEGKQGKEEPIAACRHCEASLRREAPEESVLDCNEDARSQPSEESPSMTHIYIQTAAGASGADSFIDKLPSQYDNILGRLFDDGTEISYGEWQKLGLSRALFGEKEIILLDEPFSHQYHAVLDRFFEYIAGIKKDRICLLITHDPAVASRADKVIDLGKI
jgi:ABC-type transport system involved in Fe-S cluster assembly fused permease/ATPase subunit